MGNYVIRLNKNRGWRGLAELVLTNKTTGEVVADRVFTFSPNTWGDLLHGHIVYETEDKYIIVNFDDVYRLPRPNQQRSVLIKNVELDVINAEEVNKDDWVTTTGNTYHCIYHYRNNSNRATNSDWNCIGIRVQPDL